MWRKFGRQEEMTRLGEEGAAVTTPSLLTRNMSWTLGHCASLPLHPSHFYATRFLSAILLIPSSGSPTPLHCWLPLPSGWVLGRVSSKQSNFFFGSNQNKPKINLFRLFFGLFQETKKHFFQFVSACFGVSVQSKQPKQTEFSLNKPKKSPKNVIF